MSDQQVSNKQGISRVVHYLKLGVKPGRIPELDGLRAIAIILVLLYHFATFYRENNGSYYRNVITGLFENFIQNGWLGVDLFFVLSGYLIFHHLLKKQDHIPESVHYRRYALKRILRTFPLYYAMLLLIGLGAIPFNSTEVNGTTLIVHLLFLQDYIGPRILEPMWSLATEEKFYLLAPLLLFLNKWPVKRATIMLLSVMVLVFIYRSVLIHQVGDELNTNQFFIDFRLPFHFAVIAILVGVLVALLQRYSIKGMGPISLIVALLLMVIILLSVKLLGGQQWQMSNWLHLLMILLFGFMVWAAVKFTGGRWLGFLRSRFMRIIAVLSYALYLVHYAILPWVFWLHRTYIRSEEPWVHASTFMLMYISMTVLVSLVLHYLVEKPFLLWKDRL